MNKKAVFILALLPLLYACTETIFTGRKALNLISIDAMNQLSFAEYQTYLTENKPMEKGKEVDLVRRVGNDIRMAVETYYGSIGKSEELKNFAWEFNVVDDKETINAFCMPGGKVVVYTGILAVTKNEDALAVVMGHEIAHALAQHGNERMSQGLMANLGIECTGPCHGPEAGRNPPARYARSRGCHAGGRIAALQPYPRKRSRRNWSVPDGHGWLQSR
jgi:hypothetical protein